MKNLIDRLEKCTVETKELLEKGVHQRFENEYENALLRNQQVIMRALKELNIKKEIDNG